MGARAKPASSERTTSSSVFNLSAGQAVVEMVLILPILLLLIVGALEFGRLFFTKIILTNAAREGAYYLSLNPEDSTNCIAGVCYQGTILTAKEEANNSGITLNDVDIVACNSCGTDSNVKVTVQTAVDNMLLLSWMDTGGHLKGEKGSITVQSAVEMMEQ